MVIVGIDGGLDGGLARLEGETLETCPMPTIGDGKRTVDLQRVVWLLEQWKPAHVFLEVAHPMPKQGVTSTFCTGRCFGELRGVIAALGLANTEVRARAWQSSMLEGTDRGLGTKPRALLVAQRLWPAHSWLPTPRCRTPHDGMTDAALVAAYGQRLAKVWEKFT